MHRKYDICPDGGLKKMNERRKGSPETRPSAYAGCSLVRHRFPKGVLMRPFVVRPC